MQERLDHRAGRHGADARQWSDRERRWRVDKRGQRRRFGQHFVSDGSVISVNADGTGSISVSGGITITRNANGILNITLPTGTDFVIATEVDVLGQIIQNGPQRGLVCSPSARSYRLMRFLSGHGVAPHLAGAAGPTAFRWFGLLFEVEPRRRAHFREAVDSVPQPTKLGRIAVIGAGAVGGYYGAQLARVGEEVTFLFRRDLAAVRARGLTVRLHHPVATEFRLQPVNVAATPAEIGPVDLVLVALKATANDAFPALIPPLLHERTRILTLQNGLGNEEQLAALFGAERIAGGLCFICLNRAESGAIDCFLPGSISIGKHGRPASAQLHALAAAWGRAGVKCSVTDDLAAMRWRKLVWNVPFNGLAIAAGGVTTDQIIGDAALLDEARALMREIQAAAAAHGHEIPDAFLQKQVEVTRPMGPYKPSSLIDFLAGRAVEIEAIWGEPLRRAQAAGVAMPRLAVLYQRLCEVCAPDPATRDGVP